MNMKKTVLAAAMCGVLAAMAARDPAGPYVWWHWLGSNVSEAGIRRDMKAMGEAGIAGATIFNITAQAGTWQSRLVDSVNPALKYRNDEYWRLLLIACEEAKKNGVELGIHNCAGFSTSGGTWIDPAHAMKKVVVSSAPVGTDRADIPQPETILGFYRDIGFAEADGRIWRIGYTCTGVRSHPVPTEIEETALECDKMSVAATKLHLKNVLEPLKTHLGAHFGTTLRHMTMDSYEAGPADWTDDMREEFARRRGYDPLPFLPALGGAKVVGAEKFRRDLADTVSELYCERHYKLFREALDDCGLIWYFEPYVGPFKTADAWKYASVPMVEFWASGKPPPTSGTGIFSEEWIKTAALMKDAPIVAAEAFTALPQHAAWSMTPEKLKPYADLAFASGVNRLFLHHWVHQPFDEGLKPGMTMGWWGTHFGENQSWFEPGKEFFAYLTRCQRLLQRGVRVDPASVAEVPSGICATARRDGATTILFTANVTPKRVSGYSPFESRFTVTDEKGSRTFNPVRPDEPVAKPPEGDKAVLPLSFCYGVRCEEPWGADGNRVLAELKSLSELDDPRFKYYSGRLMYWVDVPWGKYEKELKSPKRIVLKLGRVEGLCRVKVNDVDFGVLWCNPWEVDVTRAIKGRSDHFEFEVWTTWANRMIGDELLPQDCEWGWIHSAKDDNDKPVFSGRGLSALPDFAKGIAPRTSGRVTFSTWDYFSADAKPRPSGLIGPVVLEVTHRRRGQTP